VRAPPEVVAHIQSSTRERPIVFTAQSKTHFYCRDAICEFVFKRGAVPVNPFRTFGYFLGDRVDRDVVREANNNLIRIADELWVFGTRIANGVLFEIAYARDLGKPVRLYTVGNRSTDIRPVPVERLRFENELYGRGVTRENLIAMVEGNGTALEGALRLFDLDEVDAAQPLPIVDTA
jgi:hypothetical protein